METDAELLAKCERRVGQVLGSKWQLDGLLGVGGMAAVYSATHRNGAVSAIKLLHPEFSAQAEVRERFLREAYIGNRVDHPGVVKVLDDDVSENDEPYLVMELLRGESVEAWQLRLGGRPSLGEVLRIVDSTLAILEKAHSLGIVHRDLKPENLFLTEAGEIKLLDFGIARLREGNESKSRTRTGMVMGTPAYMAPEQALGRWSIVDARTDLWAVGAILYTLVSGRVVHEAATGNEMLVYAATRPAQSLARVADAPFALVRFVDRALEYDQSRRFQDASSMRGALFAVIAELSGPAAAVAALPANASAHAPTLAPEDVRPAPRPSARPVARPSARPSARPPRIGGDGDQIYDPSFVGSDELGPLGELFRQVEHALFTRQQYGVGHPEAERRFEQVVEQCQAAIAGSSDALVWHVTPYAFTVRDRTLWEPRAPFDHIPYQLFADGMRLLGILPGIEPREISELMRILTLDRTRDVAPEDDFVTILWEANLEHVVYQAIDTYAEGDQQARAGFERDTNQIVALANFDASFQLEECWQESAGQSGEALLDQHKRLLSLVNETRDPEALSRAESFQLRELEAPTDARAAVFVDPSTIQALAGQLEAAATIDARFAGALAASFVEGIRAGTPAAVTAPVRAALDALSRTAPEATLGFVSALMSALGRVCEAGEAPKLRGLLGGAVISEKTLRALLGAAGKAGANVAALGAGLMPLLAALDGTHVRAALELLPSLPDGEIKEALVDYVAKNGEGHEAEMGALFAQADLDLGLALIRVLAKIKTPAARDAIVQAAQSRHAVVRIEALGHLEGASGERLRLELRSLLEDPTPEVRVAALRAIQTHLIRPAGPYLVLRIKSSGFDKLPLDERRQALAALAALAPARAEAVCLELLAEAPMVTTEHHEESRAAAAELLGQIAVSGEAIRALAQASGSRWRNSERVRASAGRAKEQIQIRVSVAPPADAGTGTGRRRS
jgi:eukaryotic-like serine/threonine-protein kinase